MMGIHPLSYCIIISTPTKPELSERTEKAFGMRRETSPGFTFNRQLTFLDF